MQRGAGRGHRTDLSPRHTLGLYDLRQQAPRFPLQPLSRPRSAPLRCADVLDLVSLLLLRFYAVPLRYARVLKVGLDSE